MGTDTPTFAAEPLGDMDMRLEDAVAQLLDCYPKIFFACHQRHRRDPKTGRQLSSHQAQVLDHLDEVDPLSMTGLAQHMGVTPSTMSLTVDRLERKGYVLRERDAVDARRVNLRLTSAGARVKEAASVLEPESVRAMLDAMSPESREKGVAGLVALSQAAEALMRSKSHQGSWRRRGRKRAASKGDSS